MDDWELVQGSDTESTDSIASNKVKSSSSSVIDDGMILSDHFSADDNLLNIQPDDHRQGGVMEPDDSSMVDFGLEPQVLGLQSNELGFYDSRIESSVDGGFDEKQVENEAVADFTGMAVSQSVVEEPIEDSSKSCSDLVLNEKVTGGDSEIVNGGEEEEEEEEVVADSGVVVSTEAIEGSGGVDNTLQVREVNSEVRSGGDESKSKETVWWKMPFVLLKYCAFRIGPVWSVSMAAAVMGFVLLGRRLYNMKKKAQRFNLKVTIDDKKVSRVISQAARLNEGFTEVRRVPVIRPALPAPGAWPVLSLR